MRKNAFDVSTEDAQLINEIVKRARKRFGKDIDGMSLHMDLTAAHTEVNLRLEELLNADDFNFAHDVLGIIRHMNRQTAQLSGHFLPRYARPT